MSSKDKILDYIKNILEVPRDEYSGMSACPFAKKERETDNIFIDTINNDSSFMECMDKFIKTDKNSAVFIQEGDIDMPEEYTKPYQKFLNSLLKENNLNHWKALCINPNDKLDVNGFNARALSPCFLVLINNKKDIYFAWKKIQETKYYDKMSNKYKNYLGVKNK